jgi:hypothetical protein
MRRPTQLGRYAEPLAPGRSVTITVEVALGGFDLDPSPTPNADLGVGDEGTRRASAAPE